MIEMEILDVNELRVAPFTYFGYNDPFLMILISSFPGYVHAMDLVWCIIPHFFYEECQSISHGPYGMVCS
jgi:hypothetical protein